MSILDRFGKKGDQARDEPLMGDPGAREAGPSTGGEPDLNTGPPPSAEPRSAKGENVEGERDIPSVNAERSLQSRVNSWMALAVMLMMGGGFLYFYYSSQFAKTKDAEIKVAQERASKAGGEMKLPPLGRVDGPQAARTDVSGPPTEGPTMIGDVLGPAPPLGSTPGAPGGGAPIVQQGPPVKTQAQLDLERKLTPAVLYRPNLQGTQIVGGLPNVSPSGALLGNLPVTGAGSSALGTYLQPTATPATSAQVLATRRFVIPKGNFVDCTLETALDSQLPGLATCVTAFDIFGADGKVVLVERGSKLVGETKGEARQGMNRMFVLWNEARTPSGVVVQLASPATDTLGRSGIEGHVDTHFWQRFGAAIMISVIEGTLQTLVQSQRSGNGSPSITYNPQGSREVITEVLRNTIAIPPTIRVNQGTRIQVIVARDVDFRSVYELQAAFTGTN